MKIHRRVKIALISLAVFVVTILVLVVGLLAWIISNPRAAWDIADKYFLPEDLKIEWQDIEFTKQKKSWRHWDIAWRAEGITIVKGTPAVDVGIEKVHLVFDLNLWTTKPWVEFETLQLITRDKNTVHLPPSEKSNEELSPYQQVQTYLEMLSNANHLSVIEIIDVQVPHFAVHMAEGAPWVVSARIAKPIEGKPAGTISIAASGEQGSLSFKIDGLLASQNLGEGEPFLNADIEAKDKTWSVKTDLQAAYVKGEIKLSAKPQIRYGEGKKPIEITPSLSLLLKAEAAELDVAAMKVINVPGPFVKFDKVAAKVRMPFADDRAWSAEPTTFNVKTGVDLFLIDKDMRPPFEKACRCKLPEEFAVNLSGEVWLNELIHARPNRQDILSAKLKIDSIRNKLFSADIAASLKMARNNNQWIYEPATDTEITVHSFQGLRQYLDAKGIMIPAPLDILDGTLQFSAHAPVARDADSMVTDAQFKIDLASPTQKVVVDTTVNLDLANTFKSLDVAVDALIKTARLELPPIDPVLGVPKFSGDSRVLRAPKPKAKPSNFKMEVVAQVRTEKAGAIQLLNKYAKPAAPVTVNMRNQGAVTTGFVRLEPFLISYLRREVNVERLEVQFKGGEPGEDPMQGRFRMNQGGYIIFIDIKGTVGSPSIHLSSDPSLPKSDIISVLLYGRPADRLVAGEADAAGGFSAAMADRAIGLFGLWAFATTPIQSFSYNPVTKVYTATVSLGEGLTAGVGTNWEQATNLEVRKRLSRKWVLTASWVPTEDKDQKSQLVLQWETRF